MKTEDLLHKLTSLGIHLKATDRHLLYKPRDAVPADLLELLSLKKEEVIKWLSWQEGVASSSYSPDLFKLVGKVVSTPQGPGKLISALPQVVTVSLVGKHQVLRSFLPCEIKAFGDTTDIDGQGDSI